MRHSKRRLTHKFAYAIIPALSGNALKRHDRTHRSPFPMKQILNLLILLCCLLGCAFAQMELRLEPVRPNYIVGEHVALKLTIINRTDSTLSLTNRPQRPWLNFSVSKRGESTPVSAIATPRFPDLTITPGSTRSFQVNLKSFYRLDLSGSYGAVATIRMPDGVSTCSSNRALFSLVNGGRLRGFKIRAAGKNLEMSVQLATIDGHDNLFGQVTDADTKRIQGACFLARYLNFMQPRIMLDAAQNLHILCQSSPDFYTYAIMNTQGERSHYQLFKRAGGPVDLISTGKGVRPVGVVPYVKPKPGDQNIHHTSDRPF